MAREHTFLAPHIQIAIDGHLTASMNSSHTYDVNRTQLALDKKLHILLLQEKQHKYPTNEILQDSEQKNRKICLLTHGYIKRYSIASDGSLSIQVVYGPGDVLPITLAMETFFGHKIYEGQELFYYETMSEVKIHMMDIKKLQHHIDKEPILYRDLLEEAGRRIRSNIQRLENVSLPTIYNRVAHQLDFYARQFGSSHERGIRIDLPLKHQDLADVLNSARETITRELNKLAESKLIIQEQHHIVVIDVKALEDEAYSQ